MTEESRAEKPIQDTGEPSDAESKSPAKKPARRRSTKSRSRTKSEAETPSFLTADEETESAQHASEQGAEEGEREPPSEVGPESPPASTETSSTEAHFDRALSDADTSSRGPGRFGFVRRFSQLPSLPRLNVDANREKFAYLASLAIGIAVVLIGKGLDLLGPWFATALTALIIVAYGIFAATKREYRMRLDRAGDNCYYLGLTFTLASMFVALVQLQPGVAPDELIGTFGIALGSTIAGIIMRLVLVQFKTEIDDVETQARLDLADSADRLRGQLDHASSRFQTFAIGIQEAVRASVVSITDEQLGKQRKLIDEFSELLEKSVTSISAASTGIQTSLERHTSISNRFDEASQRSVEAAQALAEKVEKVEIPEDLLTRGFGNIVQELQRSNEALRETLTGLQGMSGGFERANAHLAGFESASKKALDLFNEFSGATQNMSASMQNMNKAVEAGTNDLNARNAQLDTELTRLRDLSMNYAGALAEVAGFLTKEIGGHGARR